MIFDHVGWGDVCHTYIQSFHMPVFFVVSGYLYRYTGLSEEFKKRVRTLLIPYVVFSAGYFILLFGLKDIIDFNISLTLKSIFFYPTDMNHMPIAPALWFLPCMFIVDMVYTIISTFIRKKSFQGMAVILIASPIILHSELSNVMLPFGLEPMAVALLFWFFGDCLKTFKLQKIKTNYLLVAGIIFIELILAFVNGSVDMRSARYNNIFLYLLNGCLGFIGWYEVSKVMAIKTGKIIKMIQKILSYCSINAMAFLCTNQFFIKLYEILIQNSGKMIGVIIFKLSIFFFMFLSCILFNEFVRRCKLGIILGVKYKSMYKSER